MGDTRSIGIAYRDQDLDGSKLGASGGTLGFYGKTPIVQPAATNQAAVASTAPVSISATQWGYSTSTQALAITNLLIEVRTALVNLGIIKGSN
jgi:hypothetical protein